jgi:ADP-ribosylglycohydrolase
MTKRSQARMKQEVDLFASEEAENGPDAGSRESGGGPVSLDSADPLHATLVQARNSALWAAYGDALGFISELGDERTLKRRTRGKDLVQPVEWIRRVGGRSGVQAHLPQGCYSDDTQLRLATSRAITRRGFDVEAFAKVELPVWTAYALGGGKSTKAGATNLVKPGVPWYANTYGGWTDAGGNGAAMRIQPHVWFAHARGQRDSIIAEVVRNSICTHSSVVGILGAVVHALVLDHAMDSGTAPSAEIFLSILDRARSVPDTMRTTGEVGDVWLGLWERQMRRPLVEAWAEAIDHAAQTTSSVVATLEPGRSEQAYIESLRQMGLFDEHLRGSGVLTALAALILCWSVPDPADAMRVSANAVGSDTDTIATMAGAILGATTDRRPPVDVLDAELIVGEVDRLFGLPASGGFAAHSYPDLLNWSPPRTQADALVTDGESYYVLGLGEVECTIGEPLWAPDGQFGWQWLRLRIGQTLLIKRRKDLPSLRDQDRASPIAVVPNKRSGSVEPMTAQQTLQRPATGQNSQPYGSDNRERRAPASDNPVASQGIDVGRAFLFLEREGYTDAAVGNALRRVALRGTAEQQAGFVAALLLKLRP